MSLHGSSALGVTAWQLVRVRRCKGSVDTETGLPLVSWTEGDMAKGHPSSSAKLLISKLLISKLAMLLDTNLQVRQNLRFAVEPHFSWPALDGQAASHRFTSAFWHI